MKNNDLNIFLNSFSNILLTFRGFLWDFKKIFIKHELIKLSRNEKILLVAKGEMTKLLYMHEWKALFNKGFENSTFEKIRQNVKDGMVVFDIGANIGLYTITLSRLVGEEGIVHAFEPEKKTFEILKYNVQLSNCSNVVLHNYALSDKEESVFLVNPISKNNDIYTYISKKSPKNNCKSVDAITFDQFVKKENINKIDFIKVDIEGAEDLFFTGAINTLSKRNNISIVCELSENYLSRFESNVFHVLHRLNNYGFEIRNYDTNQWFFRKYS